MCIHQRIEVKLVMKRNDWCFLLGHVNLKSYSKIAIDALSKRMELDNGIEAKLERRKCAIDWELVFLNESVDDDNYVVHILKAINEISNCNKNPKIPSSDLNTAIRNLNLSVEINLWDLMKHMKKRSAFWERRIIKTHQYKYKFVFVFKEGVKISWDKNTKNWEKLWEKEEIGSGGASGSESQEAWGKTSVETCGGADIGADEVKQKQKKG